MKIEIQKIEFRNIFSYGNKWQEFIPNGICFITGWNKNNERRNFTGKSNLLKIFPFALYGKVEGLSKSRIVNWKNRKEAEVIITLKKGNDTFLIHRGIKPDILEVSKNGVSLPLPSNKKDFQKQIEEEILCCDYDSFMNVVYADTNNQQSILKMNKPTKRQFLENIFDLNYFTKLNEKTNKKVANVKNKISTIELGIQQNSNRITELDQDLLKFNNELKNVKCSKNELLEIQKRIKNEKKNYDSFLKEILLLKDKKEDLKKEQNHYNTVIVKINAKIKELKRYFIEEIEDKDSKSIKERISNLYLKIEDNKKSIESIFHKEDIDNLTTKKEKTISILSEKKSNAKRLSNKISEINEKLYNKIESSNCPVCYQKVDLTLIEDHLNNLKNESETSLLIFNQEINELEKELKSINENLKEIKDNEEKIKKLEESNSSLEKEILILKRKLEQIKIYEKNLLKSNKSKSVTKKLLFSLKKMKENENSFNDVIDSLNENIKENEKIIEKYENYLKKEELLKNSVESEEKERKRIKDWIEEIQLKQEKLKVSINEENTSIKSLKTVLDYLNVIKELCSDEKGKKYAISNKIPLLNQRTNYYLSKSGVNYYVKLDDWLEVDIKGPGIFDCVYENLSGAEKVSLDRSLQFAFNDINKLQSSAFFDLMILDEILDSSVDTIGMKNIVNIVKTKQKEDNSNILIVSHKKSFGEMEDMIDNFYIVEFDGKYSYLTKG